jgi:cell division protein FtsZ
LVNVTGCPDLTLFEISEAMTLIHDSADPEANIIFGAVIDERLIGAVKITVIATNFAATAASSGTIQDPPLRPTGTTGKPGPGNSEPYPDVSTPAFMRKSVN